MSIATDMIDIPSFIWNNLSGLPLIPPSKSVAESWLSRGELGLVAFGVIIFIGLVGEYWAERRAERREDSWIPPRPGKHWNWKLIFAGVVVLSIFGEFASDADIWITSDVLQTISDGEIKTANDKAKEGADQAEVAYKIAKEATQENVALREKLADRSVKSPERALIKEHLKGDQREITVVVSAIREPQIYGASIAAALKAAGFSVVVDAWRQDIPPDTGVVFCEIRDGDRKIYDVLHLAHVATQFIAQGTNRPEFWDAAGIEYPFEQIIRQLSAGLLTPETVGRLAPRGLLAKWHGARIFIGQKPE